MTELKLGPAKVKGSQVRTVPGRLQPLLPGNLLLSFRFPFLISNERDAGVAEERKRILLTGGAGFIGSHVAEALLRRGAALSVVDCLDDFYSAI